MNLNEIIEAIKKQVVTLEAENEKTSKAARLRARRAANEIKKLAAEFKELQLLKIKLNMKQLTNEAFSPEESKKIYDNFLSIIGTRRDKLVKRYGAEAEKVAYAKAVKQVKKQAEEKPEEEPMDKTEKLKEMVKDALKNPKKADLNKDGKLSDYEKKRGAAIEKSMMKEFETDEELIADEPISEDIDIGHTDDEPGMLKAEVYRIGKYAMELYKMLDQYDNMDSEVDFPHWWQSKISKAKSLIVAAKHYLDFEMKEPQIDAMVDVASEEGVIDEKFASKTQQKYLYATDKKAAEKLGSK